MLLTTITPGHRADGLPGRHTGQMLPVMASMDSLRKLLHAGVVISLIIGCSVRPEPARILDPFAAT